MIERTAATRSGDSISISPAASVSSTCADAASVLAASSRAPSATRSASSRAGNSFTASFASSSRARPCAALPARGDESTRFRANLLSFGSLVFAVWGE
jgi:hypothetical protein